MSRPVNAPLKIAFATVPKDGGTFTFYRNQRVALKKYSIELFCVTVGKQEADLIDDTYADDGCICLVPETRSIKAQSRAFVDWCVENEIDIVFGINSVAILSSLAHLPQHIRVMSRCANGFDHGYKITLSGRERLAGIIALTPKLQRDLIDEYGADPDMVSLIPNGLDPTGFDKPASLVRGAGDVVRLGFLGRLEHQQKGVMYLPKIISALADRKVPFHFKIAGKGRHEQALRSELADFIKDGSVEMIGAIKVDAVPDFLGETDIFLFTSHFEGCPNALLEALMAGCVPVSWLISGTTDFLIENGKTGMLCGMGDTEAFAEAIETLHLDRVEMGQISTQASDVARQRFTNEICAAKYAIVFQNIMASPAPTWEPLGWSKFRVDPNFPQRLTRFIPLRVKEVVKKVFRVGF